MPKVTLTDEQVAALGDRVAAVETVLGTAVFRAPTVEEFRESFAQRLHPTQGAYAGPALAAKCVVHPAKDVWDDWCKRRPGIPRSAGVDDAIHRLLGLEKEAAAVDDPEGEFTTVTTALGPATFKVPDDRQLREYDKRLEGKDKLDAFDYLALACVTAPTRETLKDWLASSPGIAATVAPHIRRIAGLEADERLKG